MEFANPVLRVLKKEIAHSAAMGAIEIDSLSPVGVVFLAEVVGREFLKVVAVRPKMVVNDIENDAHSKTMRTVDEPAHVIRVPIDTRRSIRLHAVVAPPEPPRKIGDRHQLNQCDTCVSKIR